MQVPAAMSVGRLMLGPPCVGFRVEGWGFRLQGFDVCSTYAGAFLCGAFEGGGFSVEVCGNCAVLGEAKPPIARVLSQILVDSQEMVSCLNEGVPRREREIASLSL